ncbi:MAG TPA: hypothetical protein DEB74_11720 [Lachnospiraceae bacterium]|nr:hypothetical protein [Lachnospiraceae bacterium]
MANISGFLSNILKAMYGEDVRDAIHDSINTINEEVIDYNAYVTQKANETANNALRTENCKRECQKAQEVAEANMRRAERAANETEINATEVNRDLGEAKNAVNAAQEKAEMSNTFSERAKSYADQAANTLTQTVNKINEAVEMNTPRMVIDFNTGHLLYEGGRFNWIIDPVTGHLKWEVT